MPIYPTKSYPITTGPSEFEILKASHRFLREDDNTPNENESQSKDNENSVGFSSAGPAPKSWEDRLAEKYYESLYREFAVCDLKHYKSGNFALRWRTEAEVLSGAGESTCGNTRCKHHSSPGPNDFERKKKRKKVQLTTLELPFAYTEHGERKSALVKVVLCARCVKKLMWRRKKDKEEKEMRELGVDSAALSTMGGVSEDESEEDEQQDEVEKIERKEKGKERDKDETPEKMSPRGGERVAKVEGRSGEMYRRDKERDNRREHKQTTREPRYRRRSSRSRSPRRRHT